ncbi:uncharacterized protein N7498_003979 [Penicillium cinerascens]|uniref:DUF7587 domain-containing protein n=1 Tax=Penicillium cinerascens TaxID=70096 RepID=A0A9W9N439_9EURO|nr:uncharacterized protein N7498_003979 [Penicillium cinerascens]KAJ5212333.1 hypothetical protein N7498_003979 [Penicillium cinerascens]
MHLLSSFITPHQNLLAPVERLDTLENLAFHFSSTDFASHLRIVNQLSKAASKTPSTPSTPKKTPQKSPKRITFQWDDYRRQVLCCLYRFYNCEHDDLQKIFSDIFKNHLLERGFPSGQIPYRALNAQWSWMRRSDNPAWLFVHKETVFRKDREWKDIIQQINHAANKLQILLIEKEFDTENAEPEREGIDNQSQSTLTLSTMCHSVQASVLTDTEHSSIGDWGTQQTMCQSAVHDTQVVMSGLSSSSDEELPSVIPPLIDATLLTADVNLYGHTSPEDLPPVLYRWSNNNSAGINGPTLIRAGLFADMDRGSGTFLPEHISEESFLEYFRLHVTKAQSLSPFVSFFKSPLSPIHRGLHNRNEASVFIVDTSKLTNKSFKSTPLMERTGTVTRGWKGYGEYLIWNEVPAAAIACTFTITDLEKIASNHLDIGAFLQLPSIQERWSCRASLYSDLAKHIPESDDGYACLLERFTELIGVPESLREAVASDFREAWTEKFKGLEYQPPGVEASDFHGGDESLAAHVCFTTTAPSLAAPSESSYAPADNNDGDSDNSCASSGSGSREIEEAEERCRGRDTSSSGYSVQDFSGDDIEERSLTDPFVDEADPMDTVDEDAAAPDEEYCVDQLIRWPARMFARGRIGMWTADGM